MTQPLTAQRQRVQLSPKEAEAKAAEAKRKSDESLDQKAASYAEALRLNDSAKEARVSAVIATHLKAVRDWHNENINRVPEGSINPTTGQVLTALDREIIADSGIPKSVRAALLEGLRKDLTEEQIEIIYDQYTIGKVEFTLNGYKSIVPNLTDKEEAVILENLKKARDQAIDMKNMKAVSGIFEIYKTKNEQYLNENGRNWKQLYKDYTDKRKAEKAAAAAGN
ncbi:MAG: DUF3826 domain-containing protein [Bacteroidales bacterium]|jgi:hypothetical protein|nr:DUF3826 domain-containing protein [Bacteroidales bacterium]